MITTAIGNPKVKAMAIVDVNAGSKFTFTLFGADMGPPTAGEGKKPPPRRSGNALHMRVQKVRTNGARTGLIHY